MLDAFNNVIDDEVRYARGLVLKSSYEEKLRLQRAVEILKERKTIGKNSFYIFTGNCRGNPLESDDLGVNSDEWVGPAFFVDELKTLALKHFSGTPATDDVAIFNRTSAANIASIITFGGPDKTVISYAPQTSHHPSVPRGARIAGSKMICAATVEDLERIDASPNGGICLITSATSELFCFTEEELIHGIAVAKSKGLTVVVDDAYGARIRPIIYSYTPSLPAGADAAVTNNDKAGLNGPRAGIMAGKREIVNRIHSTACAFGMEARWPICLGVYRSLARFKRSDLLDEVEVGGKLYTAVAQRLGSEHVRKSILGPEIKADTILKLILEMSGSGCKRCQAVPAEASSALGMELLKSYGIVTTNSFGMPGAEMSVRLKTNRTTYDRLGGAERIADMLYDSMLEVSKYINDIDAVKRTILG